MRMRIMMVGALALVAFAVPAGAANAVELAGKGAFVAGGSGTIELDGGGHFVARGVGTLEITDVDGDARVIVRGPATVRRVENTTYVHGRFARVEVHGSHFQIDGRGRMRLAARGRGHAILTGHGWYKTSGGDEGRWSEDGVRLELTDDEPPADSARVEKAPDRA